MKRTVLVIFEIDMVEEFPKVDDSSDEAIDYAEACIEGRADWPDYVDILCNGQHQRMRT